MRIIRLLLALLCVLCATPAHAEPPLQLSAALYAGVETQQGETIEVVLSAYASSPDPLLYTLEAPVPAGLELRSTTVNSDTIAYDRPLTIALHYRVTAPNNGAVIALRYALHAGGHVASAATVVRVGPVAWPRARQIRTLYLPYVRKP